MLTVKGVANRVGVSAGLVYDWIASGRLVHFRFGKSAKRGAIRIAEADLDAFLQTLRRGAEPRVSKPPAPSPAKRQFKHLSVR